MWLIEQMVGGRLLDDDRGGSMTDNWTLFWIAFSAGVAVLAVGGVWKWILPWARNQASRTGIMPHIARWLGENVAYIRSGFRLKAVLDCDFEPFVGRARAYIGKLTPPLPPKDGQVSRLKDMRSRPFQRTRTFAWQVYMECVPFCAQHGWQALEIHGWSRPDLIMPMNKVWTVLFKDGNVMIAGGWTPIPALPAKRATAYNSFNLPPQP
jgi:hypothetical protein